MNRRWSIFALIIVLALAGCGDKTVATPADSQELRDQQKKQQQEVDQDEKQYQKDQKKR